MAEAWIENLKARRLAITAELSALAATTVGGKANVRGDGVNVDHVGYKMGLYRELAEIEKQLAAAGEGAANGEDDPGIIETEFVL